MNQLKIYEKNFDKELKNEPYETLYEQLRDRMGFVLALSESLKVIQTLIHEVPPYSLTGLVLKLSDQERLQGPLMQMEDELEACLLHIASRKIEEDHLDKLANKFELSDFETFCLLLALTLRLDGNGDACLGMAAMLYSLYQPLDPTEVLSCMVQSSKLLALLDFSYTKSLRLDSPFVLKNIILDYLFNEKDVLVHQDYLLDLSVPKASAKVLVYHQQYEKLLRLFDEKKPMMLILEGRAGCGKKFLLQKTGKKIWYVHTDLLLKEEMSTISKVIKDYILMAKLNQGLLCFVDVQEKDSVIMEKMTWVVQECERHQLQFILTTTNHLHLKVKSQLTLFFENASTTKKIIWWQAFLADYDVFEDVDAHSLGNKYVLTAGEIVQVLKTAWWQATAKQRTKIDRLDIETAVKGYQSNALGQYATCLSSDVTFEDLIIEKSALRQMYHICHQIQYRDVVIDQWHFYQKTSYGMGVSALFYGPPGTGKTMAAHVLANELGLELYRVDLSMMVSKYIGETEKNISQLFERAKDMNALLFFDEADAFFAKRSSVNDANDRHANNEIAHLLQKLESYDGLTILATNLKDNIDDAFKRRIRFMIRFEFPDAAKRKQLWHQMLPKDAPIQDGLDLDFFAENFELSGSSIKEIMVNAAFMAAGAGKAIGNDHIVEAIRLNFEKYGKTLSREDFGYLGWEV